MTFLDFYRKKIGPSNSPEHEKMLNSISNNIEKGKGSKMWAFSLTQDRKLLAHPSANEVSIIPELKKGNEVVLVSVLTPIKQLLINNCNKVLKTEMKVDKTDKTFWILSLE